ncbi:hypothetical protein RJ640_025786 [Escallonia rubra]|uniref:Uncharacterized protein n=1 Tax=Escallonia rubra TaxID=112253 RepID=A0AA88S475_9ASTE|nr:hypothetical protein RJ640_025786 [Escallonia rubra]
MNLEKTVESQKSWTVIQRTKITYLLQHHHNTQYDKTLTLRFLNWVNFDRRPFFYLHYKCIYLHVITRFKLYNASQSLAENVAVYVCDKSGNLVFQCLKDSYDDCSSSWVLIGNHADAFCFVDIYDLYLIISKSIAKEALWLIPV